MKTIEANNSLLQLLLVFILCLAAWPYKKLTQTEEITETDPPKINFDSKTSQNEDWDEFGLASRLTIEQFKSFPGCEHYSDEEADQVIESLFQLSMLSINSFNAQNEQSIFITE